MHMSTLKGQMYLKRLQNIKGGRGKMTSKILDRILTENITDLKERGLYNEIDPVEGANGQIIKKDGNELINLSSNNYLGLVTNEGDKKLANEAVDTQGVWAGGGH